MRFFKKREAPEGQDDEEAPSARDDAPPNPGSPTLLADRLADLVAAVPGAIGAVAVDYETGATLAVAGHAEADPEAAGSANLDLVRAELNVLGMLGLDDQIEDIQITLGKRSHLIRLLYTDASTFVDVALARPGGNPGLARHQLRAFASGFEP